MMTTSKLNTIIRKVIPLKDIPTTTDNIDDTDIKEVVNCCRDEIQKSVDTGIMPAPKYFEQVAVLSRKEKNYENEIAICDMYIKLVKKYASEHKLSRQEFTDNVLPECAPLYKRMHNAKSMMSKGQTE
ncbi:MAG: hypothetical protein ACRBDX_05405 [Gammaproteobacteria bacterium]